jgi:hypothetical protein
MTAPKLKPCPFCGSERAWPIPANRKSEDRVYPIVRCGCCFLDIPGKNDDFSMNADSAVEMWNTRATSEATVERDAAWDDAIEAAEGLRDEIADIIGARPGSSIHSALCEYRNAIHALRKGEPT